MGLNLASLVQTASQALENKRLRQREEQARAAQQDTAILQRALLSAQTRNYNSQIETRAKDKPPAPPRYQGMVDPKTGQIIGYDPATNTATPAVGVRLNPKPVDTTGGFLEQKARAGSGTAVESIDDAERLLARNPEADVLPLGAALARGAKTSGGLIGAIAGAAEPLAQRSMTPDQQQFQADAQRMVHSMVGLLPGSRQSQVLFNSLVNAYTPQPGESPQARNAKRAARLRARHWLAAIAEGRSVPIPPELAEAGITPADIGGPDEESDEPTPESPAQERREPGHSPTSPSYNRRFWNPNRRP